jgi:four helix bundle protein
MGGAGGISVTDLWMSGRKLSGMTSNSEDPALFEWEARQPEAITGDPIWRLNCYRESLFLIDRVRDDMTWLAAPSERRDAKEQLRTAIASICANLAEGYSRASVADRTRFFTYALGSVREATAWYEVLRPPGDQPEINDRLERLGRVRRMLLGLLGRTRKAGGRKFPTW